MQPEIVPRPEQVRAARSLVGWSQQELASRAGVAVSTIADFERGLRSPVPNNALAIRRALERSGVVFTESQRPEHIAMLKQLLLQALWTPAPSPGDKAFTLFGD